jgi:3-phenylpropionate/trans-cinnamate dioxygenase ferredoxin reductase component
VELISSDKVTRLDKNGSRFDVRTRGGRELQVDGIVAGLGVRPNVELAKSAGLKAENGIIVDNYQRTSAAGDVAMFPHKTLGKLVRVEHEDNALKMGKQAGRNMAGANEAYTHTPFFYSDLFELGYEAVGELSSKFETCADWQEPFEKGVVYYLESGRVPGVLLWNVWKRLRMQQL